VRLRGVLIQRLAHFSQQPQPRPPFGPLPLELV
jgi:hypothetical protein